MDSTEKNAENLAYAMNMTIPTARKVYTLIDEGLDQQPDDVFGYLAAQTTTAFGAEEPWAHEFATTLLRGKIDRLRKITG